MSLRIGLFLSILSISARDGCFLKYDQLPKLSNALSILSCLLLLTFLNDGSPTQFVASINVMCTSLIVVSVSVAGMFFLSVWFAYLPSWSVCDTWLYAYCYVSLVVVYCFCLHMMLRC